MASQATKWNRRDMIAAVLGAQAAMVAGCHRRRLPPAGELLSPQFGFGHRLRDSKLGSPAPATFKEVGVVIVGGGMAGLSAAWQLRQSGRDDFVVLELEREAGGTAKGATTGGMAHPWGAHYVPVPMRENESLIELFRQMDVVNAVAEDGSPIVDEQYLCREPEERVFAEGSWQEGLYPAQGASDEELEQLKRFRTEMGRWADWRDAKGRRAFAIPTASATADEEVLQLDKLTMGQWMNDRGFTSPRLRWIVDYACRDDYGLTVDQTSAWAGIFYFASRRRSSDASSQQVITWPEGNGRIVDFLSKSCGDRIKRNHAVTKVRQANGSVEVLAVDPAAGSTVGYRAQRVIFAAPQFLVPYVIDGLDADRVAVARRFQYGAWVVANLHLSDRPAESGFGMAWDNVIYDTKSLGYVTATHQLGMDHGPTVLTWYYPLTEDPKVSRQQLLGLSWEHWADLALSDLLVPHPDLSKYVTRIDVLRWGHAMIQPRVGFVSGKTRADAARPIGPIHFAGTDLSGIALMEEAFYHGVRAADEVTQALHSNRLS